jgi:hypothetical protein
MIEDRMNMDQVKLVDVVVEPVGKWARVLKRLSQLRVKEPCGLILIVNYSIE